MVPVYFVVDKETNQEVLDKISMLDDIAAPNQYVTPFSEADISHILRFRRICRQYLIKFSTASPEEKDFVMTLADADCQ